jgi:beta-glucosidase/6-phospho-beta-glucosidase/beta-galactosidase
VSRSDTTAETDLNSVTDAIATEEISGGPADSSIFKSFWMGGFECSTHRLPRRKALGRFAGLRLDLVAATRHDEFAFEDYARLQQVGIRTARDGVRWHLIEKKPFYYDFSSLLPMLRATRQTETQVIWDLLHYGWPDGVNVWGAEFVDRFARFARATASVILEETGSPIYITPVNEISFVSWGGGDAGFLNPFAKRRGHELKAQLVRASIAAIEAVRELDPSARICFCEPIIHIAADPNYPEDVPAAEGYRQAQFQAWDMISGRFCPELGGRPEYLDLVGVNYYSNNQWIHQDPDLPPSRRRDHMLLPPSHPLHRPVREMLHEVYDRYRRPVFIAETGIEGDARPSWLRYIGQEARAAAASGVPLEGLCLYPIIDYPGWGDDRHCYSGLWGYADDEGRREIYEPLALELAHQQHLWKIERRDHVVVEEAVNMGTLDEAAREMDVAATRSRTTRRE